MEFNKKSQTHSTQCPANSAMVRRNVEVKHDESIGDEMELQARTKTSRPKMRVEISSCACSDSTLSMAYHHDNNDQHEGVSSQYLCAVYTTEEDILRGEDKVETAAAQMPNTKPKARALVANRQLIDGDEATALRDQSFVPILTVTGAVRLTNINSRGTSSLQAAESKSQDHTNFCRQENQEKERNLNTEPSGAIQSDICGLPGIGAPNQEGGKVKRTRCLHIAGILPQEQICRKGFSGTRFRLQ